MDPQPLPTEAASAPPDPFWFETFLTDLAARLLAAPPEEVDRTIQASLQELGAFLGSERGGIGLFSEDGSSLVFRYGYFRPEAPRQLFEADLARALPWYAGELRAGRPVILRRVPDDIPPEAEAERAIVVALGLQSTIALPLSAGGEVLGAIGVDHYARRCDWPPDLLSRFGVLASMYANTLYRQRARTRLQRAADLNRCVLASLPSEIVVLDGDGRILATNEAWQRSVRRVGFPGGEGPVRDYLAAAEAANEQGLIEAGEAIALTREVLAGRRREARASYVYCPPGGARRHYLVTISPRASSGGTVLVHTDVTELQETKSALEASLREVSELKERLEAENVVLQQEIRHTRGFDEIVGSSPALARVLAQVEQVAPTDAAVLLLGETGTGKELVARAIHDRSRRRDRPLVTVNCAALPATLVESELFGYEKGAFTGALQRTIGRFEVAHGGTLFLDEIGELPLDVQAKLLRVLQTGQFERLGAPRTHKADVRLVAATNRDIEREVREGRFRKDLYYRLSVFPIVLPPLRERREDVPLLVWHFIERRQAELGRSVKRVPERLMRAFSAHDWPGNVRELENVVERALILTSGATLAADPAFLEAAPFVSPVGPRASLADAERAHIRAVLEECGWRVSGKGNAAERLGLKRSTLQFRMKKLAIERPER